MSNWGSSKKRTPASRPGSSKSSGSQVRIESKASPSKAGIGQGGVDRRRSRARLVVSGTGARRHTARSAGIAPHPGERRDARGGRRTGARVPRTRADRAAILLGLAMYFDLAGPLGRGVETRVRMARRARSLRAFRWSSRRSACRSSVEAHTSSPFRLAVGWTWSPVRRSACCTCAAGPTISRPTSIQLEAAGGWLGALVAEPLEGAPRSGRRQRGARARARRRRAAHHPDVDADDGVAHRRLPGHDRASRSAVGQVGPQQHHHAEQRPEPMAGRAADGDAEASVAAAATCTTSPRSDDLRRSTWPANLRDEAVALAQAEGVGRQPTRRGVARRRPGRASGSCRR